jgi:hypothetical protein
MMPYFQAERGCIENAGSEVASVPAWAADAAVE